MLLIYVGILTLPQVVTPLTPNDWTLTFNGEHVSLWSSVGSWNLPCKSHYVIKENRVIEAGPWDGARIRTAIQHEQKRKREYYKTVHKKVKEAPTVLEHQHIQQIEILQKKGNFLSRFNNWLRGN